MARPKATLAGARHRLVRAQATREEIKAQKEAGELLPAAEIAAVWTEMLGTLRANLLALPTGLAEALTGAAQAGGPKAVEALLRERIYGALRELAAWRPPSSRERRA